MSHKEAKKIEASHDERGHSSQNGSKAPIGPMAKNGKSVTKRSTEVTQRRSSGSKRSNGAEFQKERE